MDLLFRPAFTRVKTPVIGSLPDRQASFSTDDNNESEEGLTMSSRIRPTSRVSSYMGFRANTPPIPAPEAFPNLRNPDNIYHKPSGDQLAEMLKVVMMNQSTMDSVPVQYNSMILHVLEAYQDLRMQLTAKEDAIEVLKQSHTKDIKDFEELAAGWHLKESDYKSEVKKLEVLLSRTGGGMESVSMARSRSVIHGAKKASETISRGIGTIKARNAARSSQDESKIAGVDSPDFCPTQNSIKPSRSLQARDDRDSRASASFEYPCSNPKNRANNISHHRGELSGVSRHLQAYGSPEVPMTNVSLQSLAYHPLTLTKCQLEALERQQAQEFGVAFESSTESGAESSSASHRSEFPVARDGQVLGLGILEKPLPEVPVNTSERVRQTTLRKFLHPRQHSYSDPKKLSSCIDPTMGFSFRPGDDANILAQPTARDRAKRNTIEKHLNHRPSLPDLKNSVSNPPASTREPSQRPKLHMVKDSQPKSSSIAKPTQLPRLQDKDQLDRMNSSSSSIVTAVRNNSGRSSANNSQTGRPKLEHNSGTGSSEAVSTAATAAAKALATGNKKTLSTPNRMGSGFGPHTETQSRNSVEGNKSAVDGRTMSISSTNSSTNGKEAAIEKMFIGGMRKIEKS